MAASNAQVAAVFDEMADLLEIADANPFRVRAYRSAAETVRGLARELRELIAEGADLARLPGIGKDLAGKIHEIDRTGTCAALDEVHRSVPAGLAELLKLPAMGPKRVKALWKDLGVTDLDELQAAAQTGRISELAGFGRKTEEALRAALASRRAAGQRFRLAEVAPIATALLAHLRGAAGVLEAVAAGSYRRGRESVGDLDLLVTAADSGPVMARFTGFPGVQEVRSKGATRATVVLDSGLQVDLRVVPRESLGAALHYFTGSKAHNIQLRRLAQRAGLKINEYGVFEGESLVAGATEEAVFAAVGLPWIAPELREDRGEVAAARAGRLPELIQARDLRGDLHVHTRATDGRHGLREMAQAARRRGWRYLAITDHSQRLRRVHGLNEKRLRAQMAKIDALNAELQGITLLKGIEVDILEDGSLDLPEAVLGDLDLVIGSVHSALDLPQVKQTERLLRAMDHPHFSILAHPTGRVLFEREPGAIDMERVLEHALARGCFVELNAQPKRMDLPDIFCRMAKEKGVLVALDSDAHAREEFANHEYGVAQARRGWLEKADVLNTRGLSELRRLLRGTMR